VLEGTFKIINGMSKQFGKDSINILKLLNSNDFLWNADNNPFLQLLLIQLVSPERFGLEAPGYWVTQV